MRSLPRSLTPSAWSTLAIGLIGFTVHFSGQATTSVNDRVTSCRTVDAGPILVAVATLIAVGFCLRSRRGADPAARTSLLQVAGVGLLLAAVHAVLGVLSLGAPCGVIPPGG